MTYLFQTMENFARLNGVSAGSVSCGSATVEGAPPERFQGPDPPNVAATGNNARWTGTFNSVVAGLDGRGQAVKFPVNYFFTYAASRSYAGQYTFNRWKADSVASLQLIVGHGQATSMTILAECTAAGKWQVRNSHSGGFTHTSTVGPTAATVYDIELLSYIHATDGAYQLWVNGVLILSGSAMNTKGDAAAKTTGFMFHSPVGYVSAPICFAADEMFTDDVRLRTTTRTPRVTSRLPIQQGFYAQFGRCGDGTTKDCFCGVSAAGGPNNWTAVTGAAYNHKHDYIQSTGSGNRDSWVFAALNEANVGSIVGVMTCLATWTSSDNFRRDGHFIRSGGGNFDHPDNAKFDYLGVGNQIGYSTRWWPSNPAARGWDTDGLAALEVGVINFGVSGPMGVTDAFVLVLWLEDLTPAVEAPIPALGAECAPCVTPTAQWFLDCAIKYDGTMSMDGGATVVTAALTLLMTPGANWTTIGLSHTLTNAATLFTLGMVGKAFRLDNPAGGSLIVDVTGFTSTGILTVTNRAAVPALLQAAPVTSWALMTKDFSGLDHLEAEEVWANMDGLKGGPFSVDSGAIAAAEHSAVAVIGLLITAELETLDADYPGLSDSVAANRFNINTMAVLVEKSRTFQAGDPGEPNGTPNMHEFSVLGDGDAETAIVTRRVVVDVPSRWAGTGRLFLRHTDPWSLTFLSVEPDVNIGGKPGG